MNAGIKEIVGMIRQRIANLQQIEKMLLEEFDLSSPAEATVASKPARPTTVKNKSSNGHTVPNRKDMLVKFLSQHGPSKRSKINAESGIPVGTVANLLNGNDFVRRS